MNHYANWERRLAGATDVKTFLQPQLNDAGYYRQPLTEKDASGNGKNIVKGWVPVALWVENGELFGLIGLGDDIRELRDEEIAGEQLWSWICRNPISYELYKAVAEQGQPWPDSPAEQLAKTLPEAVPAANREVTRNDNAAPEVDNRPAHEIAAEKIDNARGVADTFEVKDKATAEQALGIVNRLDELRLKAKRDGEAEYKPLYNQYKTLLDAWSPPIARADASAKALTAKINSWKRAEEKRLKAEADKAELDRKRIAMEEEERAARAADRAIAEGIPPAEQVFEEVTSEQDAAPIVPPEPIRPTTVTLAPTYGKRGVRATRPEATYTVTSYDAIYEFFKKTEGVQSMLLLMAKNATKAGVSVPGITVTQPED